MLLTQPKLEKLSDISEGLGQIFFASVFIEPLVNAGRINWLLTGTGFILASFFWILSIAFIKE